MSVRIKQIVLMALLLGLAGACTWVGDERLFGPIDDVPPYVVDTIPQEGWIQVPTGIAVRVWFSEPLDPISVTPATVSLASGAEVVSADLEVSEEADGRGLVVLRPFHPLIPGVEYTLTISHRITDLVGNRLRYSSQLEFKTAW